jgi:spheroidene monooxygenase
MILLDVAPRSRLWGYGRFVFTRFAMRDVLGLRFHKMLGSGYAGGFGLKPSASRQGLFCVFDTAAYADVFLGSPLLNEYRKRSAEMLCAKLQVFSSKGSWAGQALQISAPAPAAGPVASLTRASIRPQRAYAFWKEQPAAEAALASTSGCLLTAGVGEAPILRQATFSLWLDVASMDGYARSGAHLKAIQAAYAGNFFSESMFTRFVPIDLQGTYKGVRYG